MSKEGYEIKIEQLKRKYRGVLDEYRFADFNDDRHVGVNLLNQMLNACESMKEVDSSFCCVAVNRAINAQDEELEGIVNRFTGLIYENFRWQKDVRLPEERAQSAKEKQSAQEWVAQNKREFEWLLAFARESCFDCEIARDQLRVLWTAYCFHADLIEDTAPYDSKLMELWLAVSETEAETADWSDFESFDLFMCEYLV